MSSSSGEIRKHSVQVHSVGPPHCRLGTARLICWFILTKLQLIFTRKMKLPGFFKPLFSGVSLHHSMSVKYLGVIMDSWLKWRDGVGGPMVRSGDLCLHHLIIHHLCIFTSLVAQLTNG
jgi:hypothetical protein